MNSEDVSIFSPFLAVFIGCFSAFIFALFIVFCKQYFQQIKKKNTLFGFVITTKKRSSQRLDSAGYENCECCCCKDNQIPCQCNLNSNNNSNSLSQNDAEIDSNVLIFDRNLNLEKLNESLLDTISVEKGGFDLSKINFCQNSLDIASLDEIVNEELFNELDKNLSIKLDENDNQSFEILKSSDLNEITTEETRKLIKQLSLNSDKLSNNDKPLKVILKLRKNLPLKLHSQSIELINEKPSTKAKKLIPLLRRASLNTVSLANLVRQKSFDLEEEETSCQELTLVKDKNIIKDSSINQNNSQNISQQNKILNDKLVDNQNKSNMMTNDKMDEIKEEIIHENKISDQPDKSPNLLSEDANDPNNENDYKCAEYKDIWSLRATLESEVDKDLNDSCGDLSEILNNSNNIIKQNSIENNEEHELIKNLTNSDQRLSKNDSGYKSIERRDFSIDSKTETIYRQFTGSTSMSKESFSLGSISNQNISLCSNNSINLDIKNYKNQFSIREEPETNDSNEKITFV